MFRKIEDIGNVTLANKSTVKNIKASFCEQFPLLTDFIDEIIPKKGQIWMTKIKPEGLIELYFNETEVIAFSREKIFVPTLRVLHRYPDVMKKMQVDKGAIKYVFSGADVMCPGLTSPGGKMDDVKKEQVVAITAEGKENALAIGFTLMTTDEIRSVNKGHGLETLHHLNDSLWNFKVPTVHKGKNDER